MLYVPSIELCVCWHSRTQPLQYRIVEEARDRMHKLRRLSDFNFFEGAVDKGAGVREKGLLLTQKLSGVVDRHPDIFEDLRGKGLMLGLKCRVTNTALLDHFRNAGVLAVGAGENVLRILPPLTITAEEIEEAVSRIETAAEAMESDMKKGAAE